MGVALCAVVVAVGVALCAVVALLAVGVVVALCGHTTDNVSILPTGDSRLVAGGCPRRVASAILNRYHLSICAVPTLLLLHFLFHALSISLYISSALLSSLPLSCSSIFPYTWFSLDLVSTHTLRAVAT